MWEYIGKKISKYRTEIVGTVASVSLSITFGCEAWYEFAEGKPGDNRRVSEIMGEGIDTSWNDSYWRMQHSIAELERIKREAAWDTARINAASRRMLYEMELQKKLKELERQQKEMQRQR